MVEWLHASHIPSQLGGNQCPPPGPGSPGSPGKNGHMAITTPFQYYTQTCGCLFSTSQL